MNNDIRARQIAEKLLENDPFSQWLGIQIIDVKEGYCKLQMTLRAEMLNGFGITHGGIVFSFADSALAFSCNNRNNLSLAQDNSINFFKPSKAGDVLIAEAKELHNGRSTGLYLITIHNQQGEQVALFKGTCFRTGKVLFEGM
ncbi:hydroxyphenylacetyl-CoA thioesterase PaaI [Pseudobacter ginsenosidimutans]|uniref:Acyl-CoA thioesterase n=1 Tax=Pseudobacter ginsenosidimutans TaxID=661488 RepID=A0A4Q7MUE3_9BACT|nr:hydroxyphenylacetyl-CoA thioesterase PaaI [Pseudobacter ginsenosidimutans]QEC41637.1 hydroxyphenylacetyl-CoA thioesterase PaaI [Pseudobacter ginsenosidimutans]RZS71569.1 acyl-CoA thioesterase [Pseudobacter ginsenosidimutans]